MKTGRITRRSSRFSVLAISISLALLTASSLSAQTNTTWIGGSSNWNNGTNWSGGSVPNNGGGMTYNVFIDGGDGGTSSVVNLDISATINQLNLDADDILNILDNRQLTIINNGQVGSGQINNAGLITINSAGIFQLCASLVRFHFRVVERFRCLVQMEPELTVRGR
jgi:hypothetical protein